MADALTLTRAGTTWTVPALVLHDLLDHGDAEPIDPVKGSYRLVDKHLSDSTWESVILGEELYDVLLNGASKLLTYPMNK